MLSCELLKPLEMAFCVLEVASILIGKVTEQISVGLDSKAECVHLQNECSLHSAAPLPF